jgi:hypothetical protein
MTPELYHRTRRGASCARCPLRLVSASRRRRWRLIASPSGGRSRDDHPAGDRLAIFTKGIRRAAAEPRSAS